MIWSAEQEVALGRAHEWMRNGTKPYFTLAGFAGTGKTTLARELAAGAEGEVLFASYTGKAAHVLRRRGVPNACTIHRLVYLPKDKCDAHLRSLEDKLRRARNTFPIDAALLERLEAEARRERENLRRPDFYLNVEGPLSGIFRQRPALVVVDEYSMVSRQVGEDLLSFGVPVLALGDPGQLPPVRGDCYFTGTPDCMLTEIHRQAAESPIIRMSKMVRETGRLPADDYGGNLVTFRSHLSPGRLDELMLGADQILVGLNATRRWVNADVRRLRKLEGLPARGDKVVCLRNSHEEGLLNGQTFEVRKSQVRGCLRLTLADDDGNEVSCLAHRAHFEGREGELSPWEMRQANEFDFGYALTVHKSQGSEWDDVLLFDEWRREDRPRWLYTAITRAAEHITIVR